jgi:hypothetical protein
MKAVAYFKVRALEYERRARETTDLSLKEAYGPSRQICGVRQLPLIPSQVRLLSRRLTEIPPPSTTT